MIPGDVWNQDREWSAYELNEMWATECVCTACGQVMLSQKKVGTRHRREVHDSLDHDFPTFRPFRPGRAA